MVSIPPRFLDEIKSRLTLSDIIGARIKVTRAGREYKACCPFHGEKTPSFTINNQKQFYHCFGCGAHGDVIGFVMQHDNLDFIDAVKLLAAQAGLQVPEPDPHYVRHEQRKRDLHSLMDDAATYFESCLKDEALKYVLERGIKRETIKGFRIGYAPADGQALRTHLKAEGYTDQQMIDAGVLKKSTRGGEPYAFFRERIMFPVADRRGRIVAFGGRVLPEHLRVPSRSDFTPPKYINSSDTPLFDKGRVLYGESKARQAIRGADTPLIVTEGYMDVIACHQAGFTGAVAPMGTALTEEQIALLWQICVEDTGIKEPILCFDGDNAGRRAASRAVERILPLLKAGQSARFAFLDEGEDPDTMIRTKGASAFKAVLDSALSMIDFLWLTQTAGRDFSKPEARAALTKTLHDAIAVIPERDVQAHYRRAIQDKVSDSFFPKRGNFGSGSSISRSQKPGGLKLRKPSNSVARKQNLQARIFLACFINHPILLDTMEDEFSRFHIHDADLNKLREAITLYALKNPAPLRDQLISYLNERGFVRSLDDILSESVYVHAGFSAPADNQDDSDGIKTQVQLGKWLEDLQVQDWSEINSGWKKALTDKDAKAHEDKLREMVLLKSRT